MFLIDDIFKAPAKGLFSLFKALHDRAYEELYNPERIREELTKLQLALEMDEITEEEYDQHEEILLERLEHSRQE